MSLSITPRVMWGAARPNGDRTLSGPALGVYLHHTVSVRPADDVEAEKAAMRRLEATGFARFGPNQGISYNFPIMPSGRVYEGVSVNRRGAHTDGKNSIVRSISFVGNYMVDPLTPAQFENACELVAHGKRMGWWTGLILGGHRDLKATACPGDHVYSQIPAMNARVLVLLGQPVVIVTRPVPAPAPAPRPAPARRRNVAMSKATQIAVHAVPDTFWGDDTERRVNLVRAALNGNFPQGVRATQGVVGTRQDGSWGPNSRASLRETVGELQSAWGTRPDRSWGPITEAHWIAARSANYKVW